MRTLLLLPLILLCVAPRPAEAETRRRERNQDHRAEPSSERAPLTAQEIDEALLILEDYNPALGERIQAVRERTPEATSSVLMRHVPWIRGMIKLRRRDPEHYALRLQDMKLARLTERLAAQIRQTQSAKARNVLSERLEAQLARHFDIRQQLRHRQLEMMRRRLEAFEARIEARAKQKETLIRQRIAELTGDSQGSQW